MDANEEDEEEDEEEEEGDCCGVDWSLDDGWQSRFTSATKHLRGIGMPTRTF